MPKPDLPEISLKSVVVAVADQVSANLEDEAVILRLKDGIYFGLNQVGAAIWNLLQTPRLAEEILQSILQEYDVVPQQGEEDLLKLLKELRARGLIELRDDQAA